jgi:excisionase family DNA binding protein
MGQHHTELISVKQACDILAIGRTSLWRMTRNGQLTARELGNGQIRYRADEVQDWVNKLPARSYPVGQRKRSKQAIASEGERHV